MKIPLRQIILHSWSPKFRRFGSLAALGHCQATSMQRGPQLWPWQCLDLEVWGWYWFVVWFNARKCYSSGYLDTLICLFNMFLYLFGWWVCERSCELAFCDSTRCCMRRYFTCLLPTELLIVAWHSHSPTCLPFGHHFNPTHLGSCWEWFIVGFTTWTYYKIVTAIVTNLPNLLYMAIWLWKSSS
jgi:hypothetical protein